MTYSPELLAAVAVLDKDQPGWWRKVDLGDFNLRGPRCVLGQTYGLKPGARVEDWKPVWEAVGSCHYLAFADNGNNEYQWRALISERVATDNLILSAPPCEKVEGYERVMV